MKDKEKQNKVNEYFANILIGNCKKIVEQADKEIEEMASDMDYGCTKRDLYPSDAKEIAKALYLLSYRKLPKNSVVLSREEYEKLRSLYDCEQGSYMTSNIGDLPLTVEGLRKAVDEITRLNRVEAELQELNIKYYNEAKDLRRELKQARKETVEKITKGVKKRTVNWMGKIGFFLTYEELDKLVKSLDIEIK